MNWHGLGFIFTAKDLTTDVIRRIKGQLGDLAETADRVGKALVASMAMQKLMSFGAAGFGGFVGMAEDAGRLEQKLGELGAVTRANSGEMAAFKRAALLSGLESFFSPQEAVDGMIALGKAGLKTKEVLGSINQALKLAAASGKELNVEAAAELIAQVQHSYAGVKTPSADEIINVTAKVANDTMANFKDVSMMISRVARGTLNMKQEFADTAAVLGLARNIITSGQMVGTEVAMIMQGLSGSKKLGQFGQATGVNARDASGNFKPLLRILGEVSESPIWKRLDAPAQNDFMTKIFGGRQASALGAVFLELSKGVGEGTNKVYGLAAAEKKLYEYRHASEDDYVNSLMSANAKSVGGLIDLVKPKLTALSDIIGDAFLPTFRPLITGVNNLLSYLGHILLEIPEPARNVAGTLLLVAAAALMAATGVTALTVGLVAFWPMIVGVASTAIPVFLGALTLMGALALAGAGLYAAWSNNFGGLGDTVGNAIFKISKYFLGLKQLFQSGGKIWDEELLDPKNKDVVDALNKTWMFLGRTWEWLKGVWDGFTKGMSGSNAIKVLIADVEMLWDVLKAMFGIVDEGSAGNENAFNQAADAGRQFGQMMAQVAEVLLTVLAGGLELSIGLLEAFRDLWFMLGPTIKGALSLLLDVFQIFSSTLSGDWTGLWHGLVNIALDAIKAVMAVLDLPIRMITKLIDAMGAAGGSNPHTSEWWAKNGATSVAMDEVDFLKFKDTRSQEPAMPAVGALRAQAAVAGAPQGVSPGGATPINFTPRMQVHVTLNGKQVAEAVSSSMQDVASQSYMSVAPNALEP